MGNTKSALLVGVGGQGAILTAKVLVNGLMKAGYDRGFTLLGEAVKEYCSILEKSGGYYE